MLTKEQLFLSACIDEAWSFQGLTLPNPAVGAMIIDKNFNILSIKAHQKAGDAHAEVLALLEAYEALTQQKTNLTDPAQIHEFLSTHHNGLFYDKTIFVTLEPCNHYGKTPPCAKLLSTLKPKQVVIGAQDIWGQSAGGSARLKEAKISTLFLDSKADIKRATDLLYPFMCLKNSHHFNLFKLAMRINGDYKSGIISCEASRIFTHNQRTIATSLIISGNTIRHDSPTLDCRFATYAKHNPNIQILTKDSSLQNLNALHNAPLFAIPNREVLIAHSPNDLILDSGYNIIEGGFGLFASLSHHIDALLIHISPTLAHTQILHSALESIHSCKLEFEILHTTQCDKDTLLWLKPIRS